jgi:hypothetical protein
MLSNNVTHLNGQVVPGLASIQQIRLNRKLYPEIDETAAEEMITFFSTNSKACSNCMEFLEGRPSTALDMLTHAVLLILLIVYSGDMEGLAMAAEPGSKRQLRGLGDVRRSAGHVVGWFQD